MSRVWQLVALHSISNRLGLLFTTLLVICFYKFTSQRQVHDLSMKGRSTSVGNVHQSAASETFAKYSSNEANIFTSTLPFNVNDIMKAYSTSDFGYRNKNKVVKYILFWNEAYGSKDYGIGFGNEGFLKLNCPIADCFATDNRSLLNSVDKFDAILFHLRTFNEHDVPSQRNAKQRWIFWSLESPQYNMRDIYPLNGLFNWTMTYRLSSDIVQPYGWLEPLAAFAGHVPNLNQIINASTSRIAKSRRFRLKKLAAWFVSNCESKSQREKYVDSLAKHIDIDIYGGCGPLRCSKNNVDDCYRMLEQNYKFYLSFENSYCDNYVTEKFFSILRLNVVPVVFGGANYSAIAPPFSFVDATRFKTARHLAEYLTMLGNNEDYYNQYFWWKPYYRLRNGAEDLKLSMCGLCSRLHLDDTVKVYDDIEKWWTQDSHCFVPRKDNAFRIPYWET